MSSVACSSSQGSGTSPRSDTSSSDPQHGAKRRKVDSSLPSVALLQTALPVSPTAQLVVDTARHTVREILHNPDDPRLIVLVGPCSIHDLPAALEYARFLSAEAQKHKNELCVIMRTYFEKPRSTVGWKGFVNDPDLDDTSNIRKGLEQARQLLSHITTSYHLPCATEFLCPYVAPYLADFISWGAIGARTAESQIHRELASSLPCPIGIKNGTSGDIQVAVDACVAGQKAYKLIGVISEEGVVGIQQTGGNKDCHVVLRGGKTGPNFGSEHVKETVGRIEKSNNVPKKIVIDCSHGNSNKDYRNQGKVLDDICFQLKQGKENRILGVMIESNLVCGNQSVSAKPLVYGKSVTDACVDIEETRVMLEKLAKVVKDCRGRGCGSQSGAV